MDFSLNKQIFKKAPLAKAFALTAAVSLTVLLSGCTEQSAKINQASASDSSHVAAVPVLNQKLEAQDFSFPSKPPSLMRGREIFQQQCVKCHAASYWQTQKVKMDLAYTTPIDMYGVLTTGQPAPYHDLSTPQRKKLMPKNHPAFKDQINRDDRWAVIFYVRYLAGAGDMKSPDPKNDIAGIFGGNCAVCHGSKGQGDGFLHTGKTGNHELHDATQVKNLMPAPANFQQYNRVYNRTDAQLFKYLCEGIYPSAMPAWYGDVNLDKDTGKPTYIFDEALLLNLMRYVRAWAYDNDLKSDLPEAKNPPPGLQTLESCKPMPTNRPWTNAMKNDGPEKGRNYVIMPADPITGGMTHVGPVPHDTVRPAGAAKPASKQGGGA